MSERKALLILHGKQALNEALRTAIHAKREQGWEIAVRVTWEAGDAQRIAREALAAGYPTLIAGGGDGTLRAVAEVIALADSDASLVLLGLGTANDFATAAGVPVDIQEALDLLDHEPTPIDLGEVNEHIFLNMATGGFGTSVTTNTPEDLKKMLGGAAYFLTGLSRFAEVRTAFGRFKGPDFSWEGEFLALGIGNGSQAGGGHVLCPNARIDDGLLDVCIVPAAPDMVGTLGTMLSGSMNGVESVSQGARVAWLEVEAPEGLDLNLDGEPMNATKLRFKALEKALRVHLPVYSPLLSRS
ncbi:lipid kinase YegS [Pseudomonas sp. M30-35]|uniref:lipid kinase YegS n=1 Tax=Pseudomonas sp. M30-35 TaxID=1981174 RepID=UPI000B3C2A31|nr:lipid kinase YegS [Pseudomonas sp. M30-35]ARU89053.1 lipid kinase YegS [Pseudomonas sp. M30-35]